MLLRRLGVILLGNMLAQKGANLLGNIPAQKGAKRGETNIPGRGDGFI